MPKGTKVDNVYQAIRDKGAAAGKAARIAQAATGQALATGKPPQHKPTATRRAGLINRS